MRSFSLNSFIPRRKFAQQGAVVLGGNDKIIHGLVQHIQPGAEHASSSSPVNSSLRRNSVAFWASRMPPTSSRMNSGASRWSSSVAGGVADAVIFIHGLRHQAGIQLGKVGFGGLFQRGAVLAARLFDGAAQRFGGLGGAAEQHLAGRERYFFPVRRPAAGSAGQRRTWSRSRRPSTPRGRADAYPARRYPRYRRAR